ncbi:MAG: response regulator transcription factor [Bacillota bacterium]
MVSNPGEKILVVDDEQKIRKVVRAYLEEEGFEVETAVDGREALEKVEAFNPGLVVLDLMLPKISGEQVCQRIRQSSDLPILMLTAKGAEEERVEGLNLGADDYMTKPFSSRELVARVRAILRRSDFKADKAEKLVYGEGELKIFPATMVVEFRGEMKELTGTEFKILHTLARNRGQILSREQLATRVMGLEFKGFDRTIDAHIKNIRQKLDLDRNQYIETVYGAGYRFVGE